MLIEFTVKNYRSIHEPIVLDLSPAQNIRRLPENCFDTKLSSQPRRLLRSSVVYGPNASGKTNLVRAAHFMRNLVLNSNRKPVDDPIFEDPFLLHPETRQAPATFQMIFIANGVRYQYGFEVDRKRVVGEWLYRFSRRPESVVFRREYDAGQDSYRVESELGTDIQDAVQALPEDWLALTQLGQKKPVLHGELKNSYVWFQKQLLIIGPSRRNTLSETLDLCETERGHDWVLGFIKAADLGIDDIVLEEQEDLPDELYQEVVDGIINNSPKGFSEKIKSQLVSAVKNKNYDIINKIVKIRSRGLLSVRTVPGTGEKLSFSGDKESRGTNQMLALAGQWREILDNGQICFMDEIEDGLHPKLVRFLFDLIHDPEQNPNNAQLIATTHDTTLLDHRILRPDQIWLMNKKRDHSSQLYALSDFDIQLKKHETLQQLYLDGVFGAVPMVRKRRLSEGVTGEKSA
ncbi:MAG: AAA family ATPase [Magnetococcales bacterium]|nr:AAA family ATPase [Magnetococcales bacterium]